jgi:hypothetical protein
MPPVRRLAADVAGYSHLMGADEEGTPDHLKAHLRDLVNPKIAEDRGRLVKNTGDGYLAEFASVVDAVRCAVEVQRGMTERNAAIPPQKRIQFRAGINLGGVIAEERRRCECCARGRPIRSRGLSRSEVSICSIAIVFAGKQPENAAQIPAAGKARVEHERPLGQLDHRSDILAK